MPGLHIDNVGGGNDSEAILKTIRVPKDQLPEFTPSAVLHWMNTWGVVKENGDTIRALLVDRSPVNPNVVFSENVLETEVVEINLINPDGRPNRDIIDFRFDGETNYFKEALIKKSQWPENSFSELVHFPVDWQLLYREFQAQYLIKDKNGVPTWFWVVPELVIEDGKLDIVFDTSNIEGVPGDSRAINPEYLLLNPDAKLKKIKILNGLQLYPIDAFGISKYDGEYQAISSSYNWPSDSSEAFIYLPENEQIHVVGATEFREPSTYFSIGVQYKYDHQNPEASKIPFNILKQDEIEIQVYL